MADPRGRQAGGDWRQALPGLAILCFLVVLSTVVFFLDAIRREIREGPVITVTAPAARGLEVGGPVWIAGRPSGRVLSIRFADPEDDPRRRVRVRAVLVRGVASYLRADASAGISAASLLAPSALKIDPGSPDAGPLDLDRPLAAGPGITLDTLKALAETGAERAAQLGETGRRVAERLRAGEGTAAAFLRDPGPVRRLTEAGAALRPLAEAAETESGPLDLVADTAFRASLRRLAARADTLAPRLAALRPQRLEAVLASIAGRLDSLGAGLEAARGTAGRAARDRALRRQAEEARTRLDRVTAELLADPFAWLRVRIF